MPDNNHPPRRRAYGGDTTRRPEAAAADLAAHLATRPGDWRAWVDLGHVRRTLGAIGDAAAAYRRAIAIEPGCGIAWWGIANLRDGFAPADVAAMEATLAADGGGPDVVPLHFALGHAQDALGDHAAAFGHWGAGNALRRAAAPHDPDAFSRALSARRVDIASVPEAGPTNAVSGPIFVVGLPRSGSTLVEQVLASHPLVEATGELHELNHVVRTLPPGAVSPERLQAMGERYLAATQRHRRTDRPFFIDKAPGNWVHAALIPAMLPGARIVDVRRHPMACGLANFAQLYAQGNDFSYDLTAIGRFYGDYVRHMAQVDRIAPGRVHRVHHEALVDDLDGEVRRLLDALGLPFEPACLRFHETVRPIHSPSAAQVRRPINRAGVDRWRRYERWLGPLADALGPVLDHYPAVPPGW